MLLDFSPGVTDYSSEFMLLNSFQGFLLDITVPLLVVMNWTCPKEVDIYFDLKVVRSNLGNILA